MTKKQKKTIKVKMMNEMLNMASSSQKTLNEKQSCPQNKTKEFINFISILVKGIERYIEKHPEFLDASKIKIVKKTYAQKTKENN